ncbi:MAG: hypothetical protein DRN66_02080 [Candidatus Nanohalarchaeota archaeon]|nr:MAG: hypothetical protein DRN66_02080 [Candidatus Nanohaloarchaeota archaeon]
MSNLGCKEIRDKRIHKLGNLTLTGYNPEYMDYDFGVKKNNKKWIYRKRFKIK